MPTFARQFAPFAEKMRTAGKHEIEIKTFEAYYRRLIEGDTGMIPEAEITPVDSLPDAETLPPHLTDAGRLALSKTILLKLNGGLGTGMGLEQAKSLLRVKNGLTFLDIIARQAIEANIPLLLMNSSYTNTDSLAALEKYIDLNPNLSRSFKQSEFPKITQADFSPVEWPADPSLEWYPPGHGNIYLALQLKDTLNELIDAGYEYAFISNSDNLGAVIDPAMLGYFADNKFPFMMEVADRTEADRKGGHLARQHNGQFLLRESAQCPAEEMDVFQDIGRYKYFNTNNIWLNLRALNQITDKHRGTVGVLPMIRNPKTVDPRDKTSTPVYQLETAMGAAILFFENSQAIRVPRSRFAPVKTTSDLLGVRSDAYRLTDDYRIIPDPGQTIVNLDSTYFKLIDQLEARFPDGAPSLRNCARLHIKGDIKFGAGVVLQGSVELINESGKQIEIADSSILEGVHRW